MSPHANCALTRFNDVHCAQEQASSWTKSHKTGICTKLAKELTTIKTYCMHDFFHTPITCIPVYWCDRWCALTPALSYSCACAVRWLRQHSGCASDPSHGDCSL